MKPEKKLVSLITRPVQRILRSSKKRSSIFLSSKESPEEENNCRNRAVDRCIKKVYEAVEHADKVLTKNGADKKCNSLSLLTNKQKLKELKKEIKTMLSGQGRDPRLIDAKNLVNSSLEKIKGIEKQLKHDKSTKRTRSRTRTNIPFQSLPTNFARETSKTSASSTSFVFTNNKPLDCSAPSKTNRSINIFSLIDPTVSKNETVTDLPNSSWQKQSTNNDHCGSTIASESKTNSTQICGATTATTAASVKDLVILELWITTTLTQFQNLQKRYDEQMEATLLDTLDDRYFKKLNGFCSMHNFQTRKLVKLSEGFKKLPRLALQLQNFVKLAQQTKKDLEKYLTKSQEEFEAFLIEVTNSKVSKTLANAKPISHLTDYINFDQNKEPKNTTTSSTCTVKEALTARCPQSRIMIISGGKVEAAKKTRGRGPAAESTSIGQGASRRTRIMNRLSATPHDAQFLLARRRLLERRESRRPRLYLRSKNNPQPEPQIKKLSSNIAYLPMMARTEYVIP